MNIPPPAPPKILGRHPWCPIQRAPILTWLVTRPERGAELFRWRHNLAGADSIIFMEEWLQWDADLMQWRRMTPATLRARLHTFTLESGRIGGGRLPEGGPVLTIKPAWMRDLTDALAAQVLWPKAIPTTPPPADPVGPVRIEHAIA